jgi:hypothetical protein
MKRFVKILGVKIPLENIRSSPTFSGAWVSYRFHMTVSAPPIPSPRIKNIGVPEYV